MNNGATASVVQASPSEDLSSGLVAILGTNGSDLVSANATYGVLVTNLLIGNITGGAITLTLYLMPLGTAAVAAGYQLSGAVSYAANTLTNIVANSPDGIFIPAGYSLRGVASAADSLRGLASYKKNL